jgi:hypothetical protein
MGIKDLAGMRRSSRVSGPLPAPPRPVPLSTAAPSLVARLSGGQAEDIGRTGRGGLADGR